MGLTATIVACGVTLFAGASFFFALAESSLSALGKWRARQLAAQPEWEPLGRLLQQSSELFATITLGNTVANSAIVALFLWPALKNGRPVVGPILIALGLILIGCEIIPKTLAVRAPEKWAARIARPLLWLQGTTRGFQRLVQRFSAWLIRILLPKSVRPRTTEEEYQEMLDTAYQQGALAETEKEIILQIIRLDRKTARDVMRPRAQMAAIPDDMSVEEMIASARKFKHRRLPIYDETPDTIVGILNTRKLLLDPQVDLLEVMEFPSFVPESMNLLHLLQSLQRQQRGLAVVVDEFGGTAGIVSVEDILSEVVGKLHPDAEGAPRVIEKLAQGRWKVSGTTPIDDFRSECPELPTISGVDTVGGLMVRICEVVPQAGQSVVQGGVRFTATLVDERRVKELLVEVVKRK